MNKKMPEAWMTEDGYHTLKSGYLMPGEEPYDMYKRIAATAARIKDMPELEERLFDIMWKGWLCPASPVLANFGTNRGLGISCYGQQVDDSVSGIYDSLAEHGGMISKGGATGTDWSNVRSRGSSIRNNGRSNGIVPWMKIFDSATAATDQGDTRKGSNCAYLDIYHGDAEEFLHVREDKGDPNLLCVNTNIGYNIPDKFMEALKDPKNTWERKMWKQILKTRFETGEPFLHFVDNTNRQNPEAYRLNNLKVKHSQLCTEIFLYTDVVHSFVCCLSSLNLFYYDQWADTDTVELALILLDAVLDDFIERGSANPVLAKAIRGAQKGRSVGLGVLGYHSFLQDKNIPFDSLAAAMYNRKIFKNISQQADTASRKMAELWGEPEWCKGTGRRNAHTTAVAPTRTNAIIAGQRSFSREPWVANIFTDKNHKGVFFVKNPALKRLLEKKGLDNDDIWEDIQNNEGSVQHLACLTGEEKEIFKTAREINQRVIIDQAADAQLYIEQGQSVNLYFNADVDVKHVDEVHRRAWEKGLKSLYYCRGQAAVKADKANRKVGEALTTVNKEASPKENNKTDSECVWCEG